MIEDVRKALADADEQYRGTLEMVVRSYVDDEHLERAIELVRRLVLSIPTSLELLVDLARLPGANPALAAAAGEALAYVMEPEDLLPESRYGLYGYLDDAYLVHQLVALAHRALDPATRAKLDVEGAQFERLGRLAVLGGKLLPPEVKGALDAKLTVTRGSLAARRGTRRLPAAPGEATGILDRFAKELAERLASPPAVHERTFGAVAGDAGAWAMTRDQVQLLEFGARLEPIAAESSDAAFAAAQREPGHVHLVVRFTVNAGREDAFKAALDTVARATLHEAGCLAYALVGSEGHVFQLEERWKDGAALAAHAQTAHFQELGRALAGVLAAPPAIEAFREVR